VRSIQLVAPKTLEERDMPQERDPGHGEITVKVRAIGICGSDLHWFLDGRIGETLAVYPRVPGHEPAGEVIAVGKGVTHMAVGDRVVLEPNLTCGHCEYCLKGQHNNCIHNVFMGGCQADGMLREFVTLPASNATRFPKAFEYAKATLAEPLAVMMHMLELVDIHMGDTVCVTGAGPIGMLAAATAKAAGASRVFIADKLAYRLKIAQQMGADVTIDTTSEKLIDSVLESTRGRGVDKVLECAGAAETVNAGIRMARPGGTVMMIGILSELYPKIDGQGTAPADFETIQSSFAGSAGYDFVRTRAHRAADAFAAAGTDAQSVRHDDQLHGRRGQSRRRNQMKVLSGYRVGQVGNLPEDPQKRHCADCQSARRMPSCTTLGFLRVAK
jgi:L-iditol 2-dehydrogenase